MALTRIDSYLVDLDSLGGVTFDDQAGTPTFKVDAVNHRVGVGTASPITKLDVRNGVITAGSNQSTNGSELLRGYYSEGALTVIGSEYSSGGAVIGYAVKPATSALGAFLSSTSITIGRGAYSIDGNAHRWYAGSAQTVAENSSVTMNELMRLTTSGNVGIGITNPTSKLHVEGGKISVYNESSSSVLDVGNGNAYKRVEGIVFIRNTSEITQTIATNNDAAANSQFCIKVELFVAGAIADQDAIITFYAGANKMLPASTYTYWTGTPTVTNIRGTTGAGTVTWSSGNLQYTTASTNAYVRYIGNVTIWGHDRFNVSVIG